MRVCAVALRIVERGRDRLRHRFGIARREQGSGSSGQNLGDAADAGRDHGNAGSSSLDHDVRHESPREGTTSSRPLEKP